MTGEKLVSNSKRLKAELDTETKSIKSEFYKKLRELVTFKEFDDELTTVDKDITKVSLFVKSINKAKKEGQPGA